MVKALREAAPIHLESKRVRVSSKRQITIPQKFAEQLDIKDEVEIVLRGTELIIRPVREQGDGFADLILEDLVEQGLTGKELVQAFKAIQDRVRPAIEKMIDEAAKIARNHKSGDDPTAELFADVEEG
ncbi:AbrB/MazE/SpoVT family DNA-binding domain-containing protein [Paenibacillus eucommiae]|uniref:AbrB family looped-hinge helix DNA binding protein n=1 Tax=Paenibacillus eucommiae TaxID=1355755 RepID=A0ABS4IMB9_9BACL|nr:AbrB/MazE/SpoVT family DNA-binding domain-containing protein [Paenibacillus eucommiae]MBP1988722.1 AbrB family looped-hinge helix DNA binding protein [Paenibacillus eucommiae]